MNDFEVAGLVEDGVAASVGESVPTLTEVVELLLELPEQAQQKVAEVLGIPFPFSVFRVGDRVAGSNPSEKFYYWHGRIIEIHTSISCKVDWQERERMKSRRVIARLFCNLRKI